jgi:hypothetical protein
MPVLLQLCPLSGHFDRSLNGSRSGENDLHTSAHLMWYGYGMAGKLKEPMVITDYRREPVCILPVGFHFDDERWEKIWQRFEEKGAPLTRDDLTELFPEEPVLKHQRVTSSPG